MITEFDNIIVAGDPIDQGALEQIKDCAKVAERVVMCADHHAGYGVPIGGVVADPNSFSMASVGFDIGCGLKAVKLDADAKMVKPCIPILMDDIFSQISFGVGRFNNETVDHTLFDSETWRLKAIAPHKEMARNQLGTVGSGNHFVSIWEDEQGNIWAGCHFGSRGIGHKTATYFMEQANIKDGDVGMIKDDSYLAGDYIAAMELAGEYAYAGRDWVCNKIAQILGANILDEVHLHHNFLWKENHNGANYWVGRKGSTPAFPGQRGLIAASMTEPCVVFEGVDSELSKKLMYSTVHGAGRVMSRTQAAGKMNYKTRSRSGGSITNEMMMEAVRDAGVELRGAGTDESPHVYKRISEVLTHHEGTIKILHTLKPIGTAMAPAGEHDPYKD